MLSDHPIFNQKSQAIHGGCIGSAKTVADRLCQKMLVYESLLR